MQSLKLFYIISFFIGYLIGNKILNVYGSPFSNKPLNKKINAGILLFFIFLVCLAAFIRFAFDIELYLPQFMRMHATHFKWWGVELVFSAIFGFTYGLYMKEPRGVRVRLILTSAILFSFIFAGEFFYTRPIFDQCKDTVKDGVVFQSFQSTCGPASLANLLRQFGITASEKDVARAARTRYTGTTGDELVTSIEKLGVKMYAHYFKVPLEKIELLGLPCVFSFGEEHFVMFLSKRKHLYQCIDPSIGNITMKKDDLMKEWDGKSIFIFGEDFVFYMTPGEKNEKIIPLKKALVKIFEKNGRKAEIPLDDRFDEKFSACLNEFKAEKKIMEEPGLNPFVNLLIFADASKK